MKMITLFLPEKYLEMLDTLVAENLYPNRSEALRIATFKFLHESVAMLKAIPARSASGTVADGNELNAIEATLAGLGATKHVRKASSDDETPAPATGTGIDPFDELASSMHAV